MHYKKSEAKEWAREQMRGVCNIILPTFTSDLKGLNEKAIRHDVRRTIELGFWGSLIVSECGTTHDEYIRFLEIVLDEAGGRLKTVVHGSFDTLDDVIKVTRRAAEVGGHVLLLSYPPTFYPRHDQDIYDFTSSVLAEVNLATVLFPVHQWNFDRVHPSCFSIDLADKLADLPNAVAIKAEGGPPGNGQIVELLDRCADRLLISDPRESSSPAWIKMFGMQWMGTSNFEYFGNTVPRYFDMLQKGDLKGGMELYWQMHPARSARLADMQTFAGAYFIHRASWKYQGWLNGFNGGPLRMPVMRLSDGGTRRLRDAAVRAKVIDDSVSGGLDEYYLGRNPA